MQLFKKKLKETKENVRDRINKVLELPADTIGDTLKLSIIDNSYILVEGKSKVADYFDNYIKLKTNSVTIAIDGANLSIKEISDMDLIITGKISNIAYI